MSTTRVLHVTEVDTGGVKSYLSELLQEQVRRDHDVHLLAPPRLPCWEGVHYWPWSLERSRPATFGRGLVQLNEAIRKVRPNVIHLHSTWAGLFGRLPFFSGTNRIPVVYQPHAWPFELYNNSYVRRAIRIWERLGSRRTDVLVANCADEVEEGRRVGIDVPAYILGVPLDTARFTTTDALGKQRCRDQLGIRKPGMLLCLGRIAWQKGQDLLVPAWEDEPVPDTELVLVGVGDPGTLRPLAPTQWGTTLRVLGEHEDVRPWLWAADLLVLPSRYETVGVVVAESLSCGRPVVATRANGVAEAVVDGPLPPAGAVVPLGNMRALLDECVTRLADKALWEAEAVQARRRAEVSFHPKAVVDRLDLAYDRAIGEKAAR